jgi:outer membrane protein OmpA-like peptidoglycan-associated protein
MNRNVVAAMLIVFFGFLGIGVYKAAHPWLEAKKKVEEAKEEKKKEVSASDTKVNLTIRIGGDEYFGYFFVTSPKMRREAAKRGQAIEFTNDKGAYAERLAKFAKGEYDVIVLPVNSYLDHGLAYNYPGVIPAAIADSRGADAILAFAHKIPGGGKKIGELNDASLKFVYTADSPSSFLLDLARVDFDLFNLSAKTTQWRHEVDGSSAVYEAAVKGDGDVFVMWEPDVSRALKKVPGLVEVFGSDKFAGYVKDVWVFRRDFINSREADVLTFFESYFTAMRSYSNDRAALLADMKSATKLEQDVIESMLKKVRFHDLQGNCIHEFGLKSGAGTAPAEGVVNTILACTNVLIKTGRLKEDPLHGDPYKIINSKILQSLQARMPAEVGTASAQRQYRPLSEQEWKSLSEIGMMRVEPISFQQGEGSLDDDGKAEVDKVAILLANNYPDTRVIVRGHTGDSSDEEAAFRLSQERAETVVQRFVAVHGMSANRFRVEGMGSRFHPIRRPDENYRAWTYRFPRVEFVLYDDSNF